MVVGARKPEICRAATNSGKKLMLQSWIWNLQMSFLLCSMAIELLFPQEISLFLRPSTDWIRPIHAVERNLLFSKSIDLNINHVCKNIFAAISWLVFDQTTGHCILVKALENTSLYSVCRVVPPVSLFHSLSGPVLSGMGNTFITSFFFFLTAMGVKICQSLSCFNLNKFMSLPWCTGIQSLQRILKDEPGLMVSFYRSHVAFAPSVPRTPSQMLLQMSIMEVACFPGNFPRNVPFNTGLFDTETM